MHLTTTVLLTLSWIITGSSGPAHDPALHASTSAVAPRGILGPLAGEAAMASATVGAAAVVTGASEFRCSTPRLLRKKRPCG